MRGKGRRSAGIQGINVTPMVDIMLVLLVIYIVASELGQGRIAVDLPHAQSAGMPDAKTPLRVGLDRDGQLLFQGETLSSAAFLERLSRLPEATRAQVVLHADTHTPHGQVIQAMRLLQGAGVQDLQFATQAQGGPGAGGVSP